MSLSEATFGRRRKRKEYLDQGDDFAVLINFSNLTNNRNYELKRIERKEKERVPNFQRGEGGKTEKEGKKKLDVGQQ